MAQRRLVRDGSRVVSHDALAALRAAARRQRRGALGVPVARTSPGRRAEAARLACRGRGLRSIGFDE